jgi:ribosomal protein S12 methylthiotransferase
MELNPARTNLSVYLKSLGCAKNLVDSEVIQGTLMHAGYAFTPLPELADIIIINTCAFIEDAVREALDAILTLAEHKRTGSCRHLIVCGCLPQRYKESLASELPEVDLFIGTGAFQHIARLLKNLQTGSARSKICVDRPTFLLTAKTPRILGTPSYTAYVKIAEGCAHRCTYCTIPAIRGPYNSRPLRSVVQEVKNLATMGVKEINLIAQDTTRYGIDRGDRADLVRLLKELVRIPNIEWFRVLYCHPLTITSELISLIAREYKICRYLDIPVQHISDSVLKRMGRKMTGQHIRRLVQQLRESMPDMVLRTTVMVGFPGETERDFSELLAFMKEVQFDHAGVFRYRDEEGTVAVKLQPKVAERIKDERYQTLMKLQASISLQKNRRRVGQKVSVLVEGPARKRDFALQGRTSFQAPEVDGVMYVERGSATAGSMVMAQITRGLIYDLVGEIV